MTFNKISASDEALLNELKGNLFEFLVASNVARAKGIEASFLKSLNPGLKKQLANYEIRLREIDSNLVSSLTFLAQETFKSFAMKIPSQIDYVEVIGKISTGITWSEADILIKSGDREIPVSLKLCRHNSYVNTKSAGVKSFISKYFNAFGQAEEFQKQLNFRVDQAFSQLGHELYEMEGLVFEGQFDSSWELSDRPGQLSESMRVKIHRCYYSIIKEIYSSLLQLNQLDSFAFGKALLPLVGFGNENLLQVSCFYEKNYEFVEVGVLSGEKLKEERVKIFPLKPNVSSFEIAVAGIRLQIRVKPMNKFTTSAFKINCAVKKY